MFIERAMNSQWMQEAIDLSIEKLSKRRQPHSPGRPSLALSLPTSPELCHCWEADCPTRPTPLPGRSLPSDASRRIKDHHKPSSSATVCIPFHLSHYTPLLPAPYTPHSASLSLVPRPCEALRYEDVAAPVTEPGRAV